jgi:phosphate transport system substrate-binding protein
MRAIVSGVIFVLLLVVLLTDWSGGKGATLNVIGSNSVQPFAEILAEEFNGQNNEFKVDVQGGGSTVGVQATRDGIADVGMASRALKKDEAGEFTPVTIARDGLAIVVHNSNPVNDLSVKEVRSMFMGETANWRDVGGTAAPIRLIVREESSGTREAFMTLVMGKGVHVAASAISQDSNGAIKELVKDDPYAIGFMSLGLVTKELKALKVDGVQPTAEAVMTGKYPLVRPFLFITKGPPSARAQKFIDFVLSDHGQGILVREGLVRAK